MLHANLFDDGFSYTVESHGYITSSLGVEPQKIVWHPKNLRYAGITVFTETLALDLIVDSVESTYKVAWLIEPPELVPSTYQAIPQIEHKFDLILTHDPYLLSRGDRYARYIFGQSRVSDQEAKFYDKSKLVSMISSHKTMCEGHILRHDIFRALQGKHAFEMWGSGYNYFDSKLEPLAEYCYSISVMNARRNNWFTETLVDNFRVGTVPIFWGAPNIGEFFNMDGIITFETIEELDYILDNISIEDYLSRAEAIKENFELAKKYVSTDDTVADILINKFNL